MTDRKEIRKRARQLVKKQYALLVVLCALSIFFGTEFTNVKVNSQIMYDAVRGQVTVMDTMGSTVDRVMDAKILDDYINDYIASGNEKAAERLKALQESESANSILGRRKGMFAAMMNNINSGKLAATLGMALHSVIHSGRVTAALMIIISTLFTALIYIFIRHLYRAVLRRMILEGRTCRLVPLSHFFFLKAVKRWNRTAMTLLYATLCEWLWSLTIAGGFIKHYSYFAVPFIAAENPDVSPKEALQLSRRMMDGHKWDCFLLGLSFLGWRLLGFLSFGVTEVLWSVPYRMAAYTEYYVNLREMAKARAIPGSELMNDEYLYAPAPEEELRKGYADIVRRGDLVDEDIVVLSPAQRFFSRNFGLWTATLEEKKVYSRQEGLRQQMRLGQQELGREAYPQRLHPLWTKEAAALTGRVSYLSPVTVWTLIIIFFSFSFVGWLWEVSLHIMIDGAFINRGVLHGPWLPIYGAGVGLIAVLLYRFRKNPILEGVMVVLLCGFVEYMTSLVMELTLGMRWWDYTGYYLNLNGRICGEGLTVFALGGMAAVYLLVPVIDGAVTRIQPKVLIPVCILLVLSLCFDLVYSMNHPNAGKGITDYEEYTKTEQEAAAPAAAAAAFSGIRIVLPEMQNRP